MIFKIMKQEDIKRALQGHKDVLKPVFEAHENFFKAINCVLCKGEVFAVVNSHAPFKHGSIIPNYLAKCKSCSVEFDPYTGIQVNLTGH